MEVKTRLEKLTLDEKEIDALCDYFMNNPNEPTVLVNEILKENGMEWEAPAVEEVEEESFDLNEPQIIGN